MRRLFGFAAATMAALGLATTGCINNPSCTVEGVELLFLCEEGVEITHGVDDIPASCVGQDAPAYQFCSPEQEEQEQLQYAWDENAHAYVRVCTPRCTSTSDTDAWCYETCDATGGQKGAYCIRNHGNVALLEKEGVCWGEETQPRE